VEAPPSEALDCHDMVFRIVGGGGGKETLLVGDADLCGRGGRGARPCDRSGDST
jgi:hypothetical protein